MYKLFFEDYKDKVNSIRVYDKVKDFEKYKINCIIGILICISGGCLVLCFRNNITGLTMLLISFVFVYASIYLESRPMEKERIRKERRFPVAEKRMIQFRKLLADYNIDYSDKEKLCKIKAYAEREIERNNFKLNKELYSYFFVGFLFLWRRL